MSKHNVPRRSGRAKVDPFREMGRRLDVLRGLENPTPEEQLELSQLSLLWPHLQPMPQLRPARRYDNPTPIPED